MMKITFLGDIMCEPPVLRGAKKPDGSYDFGYTFDHVRSLIREADYVVSNLETPLAGEAATYTGDDFFKFNAPDSYAQAVKEAGVDLISTVNNHTYDRGYDGMYRTLDVLDAIGLSHTGTFRKGARQEAAYFTVGDTKVAVIAYTYSTNYGASGGKYLAEGEHEGTVNLLKPQTISTFLPKKRKTHWFDKLTKKHLSPDLRGRIKVALGMPNQYPRQDDRLEIEPMEPHMAKLKADIQLAKTKADIVIAYPHIGGQFDPEPGAFTKYVVDRLVEFGADAVVASHAHCVQPVTYINGVPCAYSIGNFNMTPDSGIVWLPSLPGYGLALHLYLADKKIEKLTFSILSARREQGGVAPWPVDLLAPTLRGKKRRELEDCVRQIYKTVTGKDLTGDLIRKEYDI